jgi:tetratricopeptide (TPR) repeat protein
MAYFDEREKRAYQLMQQGEWQKALEIYDQVITDHLVSFGEPISTAYHDGDWQRAETHLRETVDLTVTEIADRLRYAGRLLVNVGMLHQNLKQIDESRRAYYFALMLQLRLLGDETPEVAATLFNTGRLLQAHGEGESAWDYLAQSLEIWRRVIVDQETEQYVPFFASCLHLMGRLRANAGQIEEARQHYEEALDLRRSHLKPTDADIALNLSELGKLCLAQGDGSAAKAYLDEALSIYLPALDAEHPIVIGLQEALMQAEGS